MSMNTTTEEKPQVNRIFISYKRADVALVSKIKERIESELHETCWFDLDGIESRQQFRSRICNAIDRATIFLFMYSKSHQYIDFENDWTIKELDYAQTKKKIVVLVNIDNTPLDNLFLLDFGSKNNIDANDATQMKKLIKDLKGWLGISQLDSANSTLRNENSKLSFKNSELSQTIAENNTQLTSLSWKKKRYKLYVWLLLALLTLSTIITLILIPSSDSELKSDSDPTEEVVVEPETTDRSFTVSEHESDPDPTEEVVVEPEPADRSFTVSEHESDSDPTEEVVVEPETADCSFTVKGVSFKMIKVAGGTFTMGATAEQGDDADDWKRPAHQVTLSDYYIGQTQVTQELWTAVMGDNPSEFKGDNLPMESVSWDDCQFFIEKLNLLLSKELGGKHFALPTEAQWEFASRGGNKSKGYKYAGSNEIDDVAWFEYNSGYKTHPVAQKQPNELGLYDMSGNVYEWCQDWYGKYSSDAQTNPQGPASGTRRVYRGGSRYSSAKDCRVYSHNGSSPDYRGYLLGFRLCLIP